MSIFHCLHFTVVEHDMPVRAQFAFNYSRLILIETSRFAHAHMIFHCKKICIDVKCLRKLTDRS